MGEQVDARIIWGCSSVGRAPALQAGGQEFESLHLHLILKSMTKKKDRRRFARSTFKLYLENCIQRKKYLILIKDIRGRYP